MIRYRSSKLDCDACALKPRCCPKEPARKVLRSIYEGARDMARDIAKTDAYQTSRYQRKKVEMLFAHLKRILKLDRLRLRGPCGARDEFHLAAIAQNLQKIRQDLHHPNTNPNHLRARTSSTINRHSSGATKPGFKHRLLQHNRCTRSFAIEKGMAAHDATTMSRVVAGNVCYRATAKITSTADISAKR